MIVRFLSRYYFALFGILFFFDRYTKLFAIKHFVHAYEVNDFLSFSLVFNCGISWGLFNSSGTYVYHFFTVCIALLCFALVYHIMCRLQQGKIIIAETLVLTGALSNLMDRILHRGVIDFVLLSYGKWSWPVFNVADCFIVVGVLIMLIQNYREQ